MQQAGGCRSPTLAHLAPILSPSFAPFPRSWPGRVPTILAVPGYLQNAVSVYSLISQGAAFLSFPFLHNVHSWWDPRGPFLGAVPGPSLLGFLLSRHQARALFGTGSLLKQRVAVLQAEGTASDTLSLSLQVSCFCSRHHLEKTNSYPSSPSKAHQVGKCNSLSTVSSHIYSAWTSDSDNFTAEIPCRKENTEYTLSKCLLALAGYPAPGRGGYIQSLKLFQASQSSRQKNTCGCIGTRCFQSPCDSTKWRKSELPVTNCTSPQHFSSPG